MSAKPSGAKPSGIALFAALALANTGLASGAHAQQGLPAPTDDAAAQSQDEIVITGQRGAINRSRAAERDANSLVNVITADSIGEFPDQNVAESVRRVPGVSVAREEGEGRTMSVRGLPPAFTTVTVNGARIGSVDGDQSFVQLDSIGSELLDSITITKAVTPNMDGDSIGGNVELGSLSAFTRGEDGLTLSVAGFQSDRDGDWTPEYGISFTKLLFDGKLGVAGSLSFSERNNYGDDFVNDDGLLNPAGFTVTPVSGFAASPFVGLFPEELDHRLEIGVRKRTGATLNFEFRPDDENQAFLRFQYTKLDDNDSRFQNEYEPPYASGTWRADSASGAIGVNSFQILPRTPVATQSGGGGGEIDKQIALATFVDEIFATSMGTKHELGDTSFGWQVDYSLATAGSDGQYRGRYRIRNIGLNVVQGESTVSVTPVTAGPRNPADASFYLFDQLRRSDINREDEIWAVNGYWRKDVTLGDMRGFVEFGAKHRTRDLFRDTDVFSFNPQNAPFSTALSADLRAPLSSLPLFTGQSTIMPTGFFPNASATRARFDAAFRAALPSLLSRPQDQEIVETRGNDFAIGERTNAIYAMGELEFSPALSMIGGVRVEQTDATSQGFFVQTNADDDPITAPGFQALIDLGTRKQDYTIALPSLHVMWRPSDELDIRASYNRALQRPDFNDFANRQVYNTSNFRLDAGNPFLDPMVADQFDVSVGWYPNRNTALQAAVFFKQLDKFFVDYNGVFAFAGNPIVLGGATFTAPQFLETTFNGDEATLRGLELSYSQAFTFLPGPLSGVFVEANVTWIDSEAKAKFIRPGETFTLPGQAEILGNLSVGWENDAVTVRLAANHTGEAFEVISGPTTTFNDEFRLANTTLDFSARWSITDNLQLSLEGSNLTEARDERVFRGNAQTGRIVRQIEDFGRTYTVGLKWRL